ncbi:hypothetical protein ACMT1E_04500 [Sphingomonas flavalba]|uniref:hypothetical protein n=1 Tax=Sphingomonas flavalba TaxID=2559804 RepID=UPI0039E1E625
MARKNQIPYLSSQLLADGRVVWHWKPSPRLRKLGWKNLALGDDADKAMIQALTRNRELAAWEAGAQRAATAAPQRLRFHQLVDTYKRSPSFTDLKPSSQAEYSSRLRSLEIWAEDGQTIVRDIDRQMVLDLRRTLLTGSKYRAAALLRVLSLLLQFAEDDGLIAANPARHIRIPTAPKRTKRVLVEDLPHLHAAAAALAHHHIDIGLTLGFYTVQRESDLLATTAFRLRALDDISDQARAALAGPDGQVTAIQLQQGKTDAWVGIPLAPAARLDVEAALAEQREGRVASTHLIRYPGQDRGCPAWLFQRHFRAVVRHAVEQARSTGLQELAERLNGLQFRDLRRSGMCWMRDLGVPVPLIAALSGHSIEETQKILDTYMPRDTRAAAEGMAMAVTRQAKRDAAAAGALSDQR